MSQANIPGSARTAAVDEKKLRPIIVRRIKKKHVAHHGGAWKIAYADFMTAMMAFFLLMWLLGSSTRGDLQGIAAYFNSPLKVAMSGGDGSGNSTTLIPGGGNDLTTVFGEAQATRIQTHEQQLRQKIAREDAQRLRTLRGKIDGLIASNPILAEYSTQIRIDVMVDGLQIQIADAQNRPMFDMGSTLVKPYMRDILRQIGAALGGVENRISLAGHTDATPYGAGERGYSNWELSVDRANASRRELLDAGMPGDKLMRVIGLASSDLLMPDDPLAAQNRRITITVLTKEAEERLRTARSTANEPKGELRIEDLKTPDGAASAL